MNSSKKCTKCNLNKSCADFYPQQSTKDGRQYVCKTCCSEQNRQYYINNAERLNKKKRELRVLNIERCREKAREYYAKNAERLRKRSREWYARYKRVK